MIYVYDFDCVQIIILRGKGDKYRHKSEVVKYDPAADNTAFKRKTEVKMEESPAKKKVKKEKVKEEPVEEEQRKMINISSLTNQL